MSNICMGLRALTGWDVGWGLPKTLKGRGASPEETVSYGDAITFPWQGVRPRPILGSAVPARPPPTHTHSEAWTRGG